MALAVAVVLVSAASAVDLGYWRYQQRLEQTAAALAGAIEYSYSADLIKATAAARTAAGSNGFTHDGVKVTVTVNYPPASGSYAANKNALEVLVSEQQPQFFSAALGPARRVVGARAVALLSNAGRNCIYALNPVGNSLTVNGSTVNTPQCGMTTDGSVVINGSLVTAASLTYAVSQTVNGSTLSQAVPQKAIPATDPCPTLAGCRYLTSTPPVPGTCAPSNYHGNGITILPATYCSTLTVNGSHGVTFAAGLYVLEHGLTINGSSNISGTGVTFYNMSGAVTLNGSAIDLTAPATGPTAGVLFYQVSSDASSFSYNGSGGSGLAGALYFPGAPVVLNGSLTTWLLVVGSTVTLNGSGANVADSGFAVFMHIVLAE
jgi:hypothetical protein